MLQFSTRFMSFGEKGMSIFRDWSVVGTSRCWFLQPMSLVKHQSPPRIAWKICNWWEQRHDFWLPFSSKPQSVILIGRRPPYWAIYQYFRIHQNPRVDPMFDHFRSFLMLFFYRWYTWYTSSPSAQDDGWQNALLGAQLHRSSAGRFATPQSCCATQQWMDTEKKVGILHSCRISKLKSIYFLFIDITPAAVLITGFF
jgi:hypothetical protein